MDDGKNTELNGNAVNPVEGGNQNPKQEPTGASEGAGEDFIKMTQKELDELLQKTGDKRVSEALKKWEQKKRLEELPEEQKRKAEIEEKEKELSQKEQELLLKELDLETVKILNEKKLSTDLLGAVAGIMDLKERKKVIEKIEKQIKTEVESRIKELEKGSFVPNESTGVAQHIPKRPKTIFEETKEKL